MTFCLTTDPKATEPGNHGMKCLELHQPDLSSVEVGFLVFVFVFVFNHHNRKLTKTAYDFNISGLDFPFYLYATLPAAW